MKRELQDISDDDNSIDAEINGNANKRLKSKSCICKYEGCGKIISSISNLSRHYLVHTGVKPYECKYCKRRFNQRVNLTKHERGHEASILQDARTREFQQMNQSNLGISTQPLSTQPFGQYPHPVFPAATGVMPAYYIMDPTISFFPPFYNLSLPFPLSQDMFASSLPKESKLDLQNRGSMTPMPFREENGRDDDDFNTAVDYLFQCEHLDQNGTDMTTSNIYGSMAQNVHNNSKFKNIRQFVTSANNNTNLSI